MDRMKGISKGVPIIMLMIGQWAASVSLSLTASREDDR